MPPGQAYLIDADVVRCRLHLVLKDGGQLRRGDVALLRRHRRGMEGALRAHKQAQRENCPRHELSLFQPFLCAGCGSSSQTRPALLQGGGAETGAIPSASPLENPCQQRPRPGSQPRAPRRLRRPPRSARSEPRRMDRLWCGCTTKRLERWGPRLARRWGGSWGAYLGGHPPDGASRRAHHHPDCRSGATKRASESGLDLDVFIGRW